MKLSTIFAAAAAACLFAGSASAATLTENSTPTDIWSYGSGNGYGPANTLVLTTANGNQIYGRGHQTFVVAAASAGGVYSFATGVPFVSSDWGVFSNTGSLDGVTVAITLKNYATNAQLTLDGRAPGNDNHTGDAGEKAENSFRHNWFSAFTGFTTMSPGLYQVRMDVGGLDDGAHFLAYDIRVGDSALVGNGALGGSIGSAVPEPATWAMMIIGFGGVGSMVRANRRRQALVLV